MAAVRMSFSFPEELREKIQAVADKEDRSLSGYIKIVLTKHLESLNTTPKKQKRRRK